MAVNPNIKPKKNNDISISEYVSGILKGDISVLSKAITLIESTNTNKLKKGQEILNKCIPYSGKSIRIGLTGVPGVGKSTFTEAFGNYVIEHTDKKIAVLAIDPSSKKTGGSILGDKTRMLKLSAQSRAFIRPSPSAGTLGGVARATREAILLCEAAGFDLIIVETVGVGQSETEVKEMTDFFLLLMLAGAGDELQGIKRGIMEMADAIVINKADGDNLSKAKLAKKEYQSALHLFPVTESGWSPKVEICSAITGYNIDVIYKMIEEYVSLTKLNGYFDIQRKHQVRYWFYQSLQQIIQEYIKTNSKLREFTKQQEVAVLDGIKTPFAAAEEIVEKLLNLK
jgi:LAO/AO transport system kinase